MENISNFTIFVAIPHDLYFAAEVEVQLNNF